jgi:hypothetical protein
MIPKELERENEYALSALRGKEGEQKNILTKTAKPYIFFI